MALIPTPSVVTIGQTVTVTPAAEHPTRTYKVDFDAGRVAGFVDETEAMKQAIFKSCRRSGSLPDLFLELWNRTERGRREKLSGVFK